MPDEKCILDPQRDCLGLQKANMLEKQMDQWREQSRNTHKELFDRMRELEKAESARNEQYDNIMEKLDTLTKSMAEVTLKVADITARPGKRWDAIVDKAIWAVLAAVIAFVLARIGL